MDTSKSSAPEANVPRSHPPSSSTSAQADSSTTASEANVPRFQNPTRFSQAATEALQPTEHKLEHIFFGPRHNYNRPAPQKAPEIPTLSAEPVPIRKRHPFEGMGSFGAKTLMTDPARPASGDQTSSTSSSANPTDQQNAPPTPSSPTSTNSSAPMQGLMQSHHAPIAPVNQPSKPTGSRNPSGRGSRGKRIEDWPVPSDAEIAAAFRKREPSKKTASAISDRIPLRDDMLSTAPSIDLQNKPQFSLPDTLKKRQGAVSSTAGESIADVEQQATTSSSPALI